MILLKYNVRFQHLELCQESLSDRQFKLFVPSEKRFSSIGIANLLLCAGIGWTASDYRHLEIRRLPVTQEAASPPRILQPAMHFNVFLALFVATFFACTSLTNAETAAGGSLVRRLRGVDLTADEEERGPGAGVVDDVADVADDVAAKLTRSSISSHISEIAAMKALAVNEKNDFNAAFAEYIKSVKKNPPKLTTSPTWKFKREIAAMEEISDRRKALGYLTEENGLYAMYADYLKRLAKAQSLKTPNVG